MRVGTTNIGELLDSLRFNGDIAALYLLFYLLNRLGDNSTLIIFRVSHTLDEILQGALEHFEKLLRVVGVKVDEGVI